MSREIYERGTILRVLRENRGLEMPVSFQVLLGALHLLGLPLSHQSLRENCEYLAAKGYLELTRSKDMPGYRVGKLRGNEQPDFVQMVKLTADAIDLLEGHVSDVGIFVG